MCAGEEEGGRGGARDAGLPDLELRAQGEAAAHRECQVCHGGRPLIVEGWGLSACDKAITDMLSARVGGV